MENTTAQDEKIQKVEDQIDSKRLKATIAGVVNETVLSGDDEDDAVEQVRLAAREAVNTQLTPITERLQGVRDTKADVEHQALLDRSEQLTEQDIVDRSNMLYDYVDSLRDTKNRYIKDTLYGTDQVLSTLSPANRNYAKDLKLEISAETQAKYQQMQKDLEDGKALTEWEVEKAKIELDGALDLLKFFGGIPKDPELRDRLEKSLKRMHFIPYDTKNLEEGVYQGVGKYYKRIASNETRDDWMDVEGKWSHANFLPILRDAGDFVDRVKLIENTKTAKELDVIVTGAHSLEVEDLIKQKIEQKRQELEAKDEGVDLPEPEELDTPQRAIEVEIPNITRENVGRLDEIREKFSGPGIDIKDKVAVLRAVAAQLEKLGL